MEPTSAAEARRDSLSITAVVFSVLALIGMIVAVGIASTKDTTTGGATTEAVAASAKKVEVDLSEFKIEPKIIEVATGATLEVVNKGTLQHNLSVENQSLDTPMLNAGDTYSLDISSLPEGTYKVLCMVPGHATQGMTAELHVGASGAGGQAGQAAAHGASNMTPDEMDASATARVKAFPAKTKGLGAQPLDPTILPDGTKQFDLTAEVVQWEVEPGKVVEAWAYNGTVPGPTISLKTGDKVKIHFTNHLKESTSLHMHGIDIPNEMDGTPDITQPQIKPGQSFDYEFTATGPAVGMYHAHSNSQVQVPNGLVGAMLVDDMPVPAGRAKYDQRIEMVLNDAGTIGFAINGKSFPATAPVAAKVGETILVDYFNEGFQIHPMHLHGPVQTVIAKDGHPLAAPYTGDTILIGPGERYSVLITPNRPGTWVWHCHILTHAEAPTGFFGMATALVVSP